MIELHLDKDADVTVGSLPVPPAEAATSSASWRSTRDRRIVGFEEKPADPKPHARRPGPLPGVDGHLRLHRPGSCSSSSCQDADAADSAHDFGRNIIPAMIDTHRVFAFPFRDENRKTDAYWRDVGTLDAYYEANMDLIAVDPLLNLYDATWPIRTFQPNLPPPKFVFAEDGPDARRGQALDSIVCHGAIVSGGPVRRSILSPRCRVNSYAVVEDSILFDGVDVGRHARIRRAIIDKGVKIPAGSSIGYDLESDRATGYEVTEGGVVVIAKADTGLRR